MSLTTQRPTPEVNAHRDDMNHYEFDEELALTYELAKRLERERDEASEQLGFGVWQPIETAPRDGTRIDLWLSDHRVTDCYFGRPQHSCGEMGQYCDCCPSYDGWVDDFCGYLTGEEGMYSKEPTHWMPLPPPPQA